MGGGEERSGGGLVGRGCEIERDRGGRVWKE